MKLVVAGLTGFVGTGILRQALSNPAITSLIALGRRRVLVPNDIGPGADPSKLRSVICDDFSNYPEAVEQELAGADACIWAIGIGPFKSRAAAWEDVRRINHDYTVAGLEALTKLPRKEGAAPFRFVYLSGVGAVRDPAQKPRFLGEYCLLRGETENRLLEIAKDSGGAVEVAIAKPGWVYGTHINCIRWLGGLSAHIMGVPSVTLEQLSATMIKQAVQGIDKDILPNEDLVTIGQQALQNVRDSLKEIETTTPVL